MKKPTLYGHSAELSSSRGEIQGQTALYIIADSLPHTHDANQISILFSVES